MRQFHQQKGLVPLKAVIDTKPVSRAGAGSIGPTRHKRIHRKMTAPASALGAGLFVESLFIPQGFHHINHEGHISSSGTGTENEGAEPETYVERQCCSVQGRARCWHRPVRDHSVHEDPQTDYRRGDNRETQKVRLKRTSIQLPIAFVEARGVVLYLKSPISQVYHQTSMNLYTNELARRTY